MKRVQTPVFKQRDRARTAQEQRVPCWSFRTSREVRGNLLLGGDGEVDGKESRVVVVVDASPRDQRAKFQVQSGLPKLVRIAHGSNFC